MTKTELGDQKISRSLKTENEQGRTHTLQYFNVAFTCEKGNGRAQKIRHEDAERRGQRRRGKSTAAVRKKPQLLTVTGSKI